MRMLLAAFALLASLAVGAEPRTYAVMSLVGDGLLIVGAQRSTGSHLDSNTRRFAELGDPTFDNLAVTEVEKRIQSLEPESKVVLLAARNPKFFDLQRGSLDSADGPVAAMMPALVETVKPTGATHLVLVTKYRAPAELQFLQGRSGRGYLEGIGFYIDRTKPIVNVQTGARTQGFLAAFAYFRVDLIDIATGKVLKEEFTKASSVFSTEKTESGHPWDALNSDQKVGAINRLIRREIASLVPQVLQP